MIFPYFFIFFDNGGSRQVNLMTKMIRLEEPFLRFLVKSATNRFSYISVLADELAILADIKSFRSGCLTPRTGPRLPLVSPVISSQTQPSLLYWPNPRKKGYQIVDQYQTQDWKLSHLEGGSRRIIRPFHKSLFTSLWCWTCNHQWVHKVCQVHSTEESVGLILVMKHQDRQKTTVWLQLGRNKFLQVNAALGKTWLEDRGRIVPDELAGAWDKLSHWILPQRHRKLGGTKDTSRCCCKNLNLPAVSNVLNCRIMSKI